jgi:hypothetical protein
MSAGGVVNTVTDCSGVPSLTPTISTTPAPTETPSNTPTPTSTPTPSPTPSPVTPIGIFAYAAFSTYNEFTEEWILTVSVTLDGNVNTSTVLDATVNVAGGQQTFGVTIANGTNSGTSNNGYLFDPEPVSANCLTFVSGDTRVTTAGYTCP